MTDDSGPSETLPPIDLAREADFRLGAAQVRPSSREVERAGNREALEPRVMQVLVVLFRADGAVVSREALIAQCWEGRIVGEDAINRAIGRLRRLSEADDGASFAIETIPRVGYRLTLAEAPPSVLTTPATPAPEAQSSAAPALRSAWSRQSLIALILGIALMVLAGGGAAWWYLRPVEWTIDTFKVVVSTPLYEDYPALSANGAMIAYAAGPAPYAWHIFLRNLPDGQPIQLTNGLSDDDLQPAWSPSSDQIAFVRHRDGEPCTLIVKPVPGGDERIVGHCREDDFSSLAWSPSGDALYFSDRRDTRTARQIMRLDLASGTVTAVTHPPNDINGDREPVISPDGKRMLFYRAGKGFGVWLYLDIESGSVAVLPTVHGPGQGQAWFDNKTLIVSSGGFIEPSLWIVPFNGEPQRLTLNSQPLGAISSGANQMFAVEIFHNQTVLASPPAAEDGAPQVLQTASGVSLFPDYASDGRLAFTHAGPGGRWEIWLQAPGGQPHPITALGAFYISGLRWSPDGKHLVFFASIGVQRGMYLINPDGTGQRLIRPYQTSGIPAWTADSQGLVFPVKDSKGWRLWRMTLAAPERAMPITEYGWFAVHASGTALYAMGNHVKGIWRIDGERRFIVALRKRCTEAFIECQSWIVSGDTLVYADHNDRARPRLILHSLKDGTERSVIAPGLNNSDEIARDPTTGKLIYVYDGLGDSDIALFHLTRR